MSEPFYVSKSELEKVRGAHRRGRLPAGGSPRARGARRREEPIWPRRGAGFAARRRLRRRCRRRVTTRYAQWRTGGARDQSPSRSHTRAGGGLQRNGGQDSHAAANPRLLRPRHPRGRARQGRPGAVDPRGQVPYRGEPARGGRGYVECRYRRNGANGPVIGRWARRNRRCL